MKDVMFISEEDLLTALNVNQKAFETLEELTEEGYSVDLKLTFASVLVEQICEEAHLPVEEIFTIMGRTAHDIHTEEERCS